MFIKLTFTFVFAVRWLARPLARPLAFGISRYGAWVNFFFRMPWTGLVKTYNTNAQTPDSAGTATAMNSGSKTKTVSVTTGNG